MKPKLKSKGTALVTGGAKRIGFAICRNLAENGFNIALHYHNSAQAAKIAQKKLLSLGTRCETFRCDLSDPKETSRLIKKVKKVFPDLNTMINNASIFEKSNLKNTDLTTLERHFNINFKAPLILTRDFAQWIKKGHIINILDTNIIKNKSSHFAYLLSKKTLSELTRLSALDLAPHIRVNAIAPGLILPPANEGKNYLKRLSRNIPLKQIGNPEQIADTVRFLTKNTFITGQIVFVDGGENLT